MLYSKASSPQTSVDRRENPEPNAINLQFGEFNQKKYGSKGDLQDPKMEVLKWQLNRGITYNRCPVDLGLMSY